MPHRPTRLIPNARIWLKQVPRQPLPTISSFFIAVTGTDGQGSGGTTDSSERERVHERRVSAHPLFFTRMERMRTAVRGVAEPACREP